MDESYWWRFPILVIRAGVKRFGWKTALIGWGLATGLAVILNYTT